MNVTIGIDVGTYSLKAVALDSEGNIQGTVVLTHSVSIPSQGYAEQDADSVWWNGLVNAINHLMQSRIFCADEVRCIGISTTAPCVVSVDSRGRVLRPAILYGIDVRAAKQIERLNNEFGDEVCLRRFGQKFSSQSAGPKILWLQEEEPEIFARTLCFVPATTYLVHRMTGEWYVDRYLAPSYAPFFNLEWMDWDIDLTEKYLGRSVPWPKVASTDTIAGTLNSVSAREFGLREGTPVIVGTADAMAEAVSAAATNTGDLFIMYGSSIFFIATTDHKIEPPNYWTSPGIRPNTWAIAGGMSTAGALTRWLIANSYSKETSFETFYAEARSSPAGSRGLITLPYFSGERTPILDPNARGIMAGLTLQHTRADIARSILEGVAFGIRHNVESIESSIGNTTLIGAGGGVTDLLWPQLVSDICQRPQRVMRNTHAAIGSALLSGFATGLYNRHQMTCLSLSIGHAVEIIPTPSLASVYDELFDIYTSLYRTTRDQIHQLSKFNSTDREDERI